MSSAEQAECRSRFIADSPIEVEKLIHEGALVIPRDFDWKASLQEREKAFRAIRSVAIETHNNELIKYLSFNDISDEVYHLDEGEFIVEVQVRAAKVVDAIHFVTNQGRRLGAGGTGGYYNSYKGQCLIGGEAPVELWHLKNLVKSFVPHWYQDPLYKFITPRLSKITVVSGKLVNLLSFEWTNGRTVHSGAEFEGLVPMTLTLEGDEKIMEIAQNRDSKNKHHKYVIILDPDEHVTCYQLRMGQVMDSIIFQTDKRTLGPFGGKGGKLQTPEKGKELKDVVLESVVWKDNLILKKIDVVWG
eukprot:TRINITY_DN5661_c0_g1_i10.p1 TRINITY_DN5661_c0_g1~~TRINITY_DN5661_c0_g1_i10.p1  ORF type:complete len:302 (-),score=61.01 TRINITY_DN5661_c0_g1_i10:165-1070(-)